MAVVGTLKTCAGWMATYRLMPPARASNQVSRSASRCVPFPAARVAGHGWGCHPLVRVEPPSTPLPALAALSVAYDARGKGAHGVAGIFITEGMRLRIPAGGLTIGITDEGRVESALTLEVALDVWPFWLDIGIDHAAGSRSARQALDAALASAGDEPLEGERQTALMAEECKAGMVAIGAAAFRLTTSTALFGRSFRGLLIWNGSGRMPEQPVTGGFLRQCAGPSR